ncbi:MAG: hypothetical protein L0K86_27875 [Actinomycetia bacterium]|nr:hypothetical protein [Actinomycetes bacterium]
MALRLRGPARYREFLDRVLSTRGPGRRLLLVQADNGPVDAIKGQLQIVT